MSLFDSIRAKRDKRIDQVVGRKLTIEQRNKEQDEAEGFVPRKNAFGHLAIEPYKASVEPTSKRKSR